MTVHPVEAFPGLGRQEQRGLKIVSRIVRPYKPVRSPEPRLPLSPQPFLGSSPFLRAMAPRSPSRGRPASRGRRSPGRRSSNGRRHTNIEAQINEAVKKLLKEKSFLDKSISNRAGAKWPCPCGFKTNFSVRTTCYQCLAPKPSTTKSGPTTPSQRTPAAEAVRAAARLAASLAPPPPVVVTTAEEDLKQARSRYDWAKSYVGNSPNDTMASDFMLDCEAKLKKAKQVVEASRSHPQRLTACLSRQARQRPNWPSRIVSLPCSPKPRANCWSLKPTWQRSNKSSICCRQFRSAHSRHRWAKAPRWTLLHLRSWSNNALWLRESRSQMSTPQSCTAWPLDWVSLCMRRMPAWMEKKTRCLRAAPFRRA